LSQAQFLSLNSTTTHRIEKCPQIYQTNGCSRSDNEGREAHGVHRALIFL
jgi:hypothetical protein